MRGEEVVLAGVRSHAMQRSFLVDLELKQGLFIPRLAQLKPEL